MILIVSVSWQIKLRINLIAKIYSTKEQKKTCSSKWVRNLWESSTASSFMVSSNGNIYVDLSLSDCSIAKGRKNLHERDGKVYFSRDSWYLNNTSRLEQ